MDDFWMPKEINKTPERPLPQPNFFESLFGIWNNKNESLLLDTTETTLEDPSSDDDDDDEEKEELLYVQQREKLRSSAAAIVSPEKEEESESELQAKYDELLVYSKQLQEERDYHKKLLQQTIESWNQEKSIQAQETYEQNMREFLGNELERMVLIAEADPGSIRSNLSLLKDRWESPTEWKTPDYVNQEPQDALSPMESKFNEELRKYESRIYNKKKQDGFKDKRLQKTIDSCRDTRSKLRKVQDPILKRDEKIQEIKKKQRLQGQGPLQLTENKLQDTRTNLRRVERNLFE